MIPLLRLCQAESCPAFVLGLALLASLGGGEVELLVSIFLASAPCILTTRLNTIIHSNVIKLPYLLWPQRNRVCNFHQRKIA